MTLLNQGYDSFTDEIQLQPSSVGRLYANHALRRVFIHEKLIKKGK